MTERPHAAAARRRRRRLVASGGPLALLQILVLGCTAARGPDTEATRATSPAVDGVRKGAQPALEPDPGEAVPTASPALPESATAPAPSTSGPDPDPAGSPVAAYLDDPEALATGSRFFRGVCTGYCHSTEAARNLEAPDLFDCVWDHGDSDADIFRVIALGVPDTRMQGFQGKLPDSELWKIVAFLRHRSRCP